MVDDARRVTIDLPFEAAVGAVACAIQREGLTILARIDVRDHFKTELHHDFRQYMLVEAWVPALAFEEIRADLDEGASMPIRFAVYELADGETGRRFLGSLRVFQLAESLGGVESLCSHPGEMTHAAVPAETREQMGLADRLVRLSVGIEDGDDLEDDLERALDAL